MWSARAVVVAIKVAWAFAYSWFSAGVAKLRFLRFGIIASSSGYVCVRLDSARATSRPTARDAPARARSYGSPSERGLSHTVGRSSTDKACDPHPVRLDARSP